MPFHQRSSSDRHAPRAPGITTMQTPPFTRGTLVCAVSLMLGACATQSVTEPPVRTTLPSAAINEAVKGAQGSAEERARVYRGSGIVVKGQQPGGVVGATPQAMSTGSGVVLNFEGADLREVVRNILGDILNEAYTIDPAVGGQVT